MAHAPHRLYGVYDGATSASAADWAPLARTEIADAHRQGRLPILVGGTGLYIRTLIEGIAPIPPIDPGIRAAVRSLSVADGHAALAREDPGAADRLRPTDTTRVARALEVIRSTGRSIDEWRRESTGGIGDAVRLLPAILLPPRDWIRARCDARFLAMLDAGAVAEVEALLARHLDPALPVMRAIGVREIAAWIAGEIDRDTMIERAQAATRQYAKRQYTWFTHQPPADWPRHHAQLDNAEIDKIVIKLRDQALTS